MSTNGSFTSKALARFGGLKPQVIPFEPVWSLDNLVAELRRTGLADLHIASRAEIEHLTEGSPEYAANVACMGGFILFLVVGLGVHRSIVEHALLKIWDDVCQALDPLAVARAARDSVARRLGALGLTSAEVAKLYEVF
jgi:hypothetical protein